MDKKLIQIAVCSHPIVRKGYYLGLQIDAYVCIDCGKSGTGPDWPKLKHAQSRALSVYRLER